MYEMFCGKVTRMFSIAVVNRVSGVLSKNIYTRGMHKHTYTTTSHI